MNVPTHSRRLSLLALLFAGNLVLAQVPVDDNGNPIGSSEPVAAAVATDTESAAPLLKAGELDTLVGRIALYPDDLLAIVLPASTYPVQIVEAARFLDDYEQDSSLQPDESWDDSVVALLNYPEVLRMMNHDLDWTWQLGEAVVAQQPDVIAAVEAFRDKAYAAGNLKTDDHQTVTRNDEVIEIAPADEEVIYVPYYEPADVVVYQPRRVYHYYSQPYPVYFYPYPADYRFASGYFWGVTTAFTIGWSNNYLRVYHPSFYGHPYYGRTYSGNFYWREPNIVVFNRYYYNNGRRHSDHRDRDGNYWRPRRNGGARPGYQQARSRYYTNSGGGRYTHRSYQGNGRDTDRALSRAARGGHDSAQSSSTQHPNLRRVNPPAASTPDRSRPLAERESRRDDPAGIRFRPRNGTPARVERTAPSRSHTAEAASDSTTQKRNYATRGFAERSSDATISRQRPAVRRRVERPLSTNRTRPALPASRPAPVNRPAPVHRSTPTPRSAPVSRPAPPPRATTRPAARTPRASQSSGTANAPRSRSSDRSRRRDRR